VTDETGAGTGTTRPRAAPRRMAPREREQMILDAAMDFFADFGFDAQIRHLAQRIGISQALIFRYFGSKEALIERVYQRTFLARWDPGWEALLADDSLALRMRLKRFLLSYLTVTDDHRWIRISMHSSLAGQDMTRRYVEVHVTGLLRLIARQVRIYRGDDPAPEITAEELELVWHLHSTVVYYLVRKHITKSPVSVEPERWIGRVVDNFIDGLGPPADA
jgi:AcrR family transcriptional regulator